MFENVIYIPLLCGPLFIAAGYYLLKNPPKNRSSLLGYRTPNALKTQDRWDFAQNYAAKEMMNLGFFLGLTSFIGKFIEMDAQTNLIAGIAMVLAMVVVLVYRVERALKEKFPFS